MMLEYQEQILDDAEKQYPYKVKGSISTYCQYNEGWSDAVDFIRSRLENEDEI
jgi:hypothetical protein